MCKNIGIRTYFASVCVALFLLLWWRPNLSGFSATFAFWRGTSRLCTFFIAPKALSNGAIPKLNFLVSGRISVVMSTFSVFWLSYGRSDQGVLLNFVTDIHQGVGWLEVGERYYFSFQKNFRTADPCPGTNFSQLWREFFFGKFKGELWMRIKKATQKVYRKAQRKNLQISAWISVGLENNCLESYVPVSFKTQSKQSGKYNHSRPLHASTQAAARTCTHLAGYSVGVLLSPQAQDFLNRPQAQCTPSRAVCMHTCFQRCFEFRANRASSKATKLFLRK